MQTGSETRKSPFIFLLLVFVLSAPIIWLGYFFQLPKEIRINLPFSALMLFVPMIAAMILLYREDGMDGVKGLFKRTFDFKRIDKKIWYLPIIFFMPVVMILAYVVANLTGHPIPNPQVPVLLVPVYFVLFFLGATGEELGWQGYACEPLQVRWNALAASLIIGIVWAGVHIIPYTQANHTVSWIVWQCVTTVLARVIIVWIFNNTGKSVFGAITFHAMLNVSEMLYPNYGSYYDPFLASIVLGVGVVAVIVLWGPKTLARYRFAA